MCPALVLLPVPYGSPPYIFCPACLMAIRLIWLFGMLSSGIILAAVTVWGIAYYATQAHTEHATAAYTAELQTLTEGHTALVEDLTRQVCVVALLHWIGALSVLEPSGLLPLPGDESESHTAGL